MNPSNNKNQIYEKPKHPIDLDNSYPSLSEINQSKNPNLNNYQNRNQNQSAASGPVGYQQMQPNYHQQNVVNNGINYQQNVNVNPQFQQNTNPQTQQNAQYIQQGNVVANPQVVATAMPIQQGMAYPVASNMYIQPFPGLMYPQPIAQPVFAQPGYQYIQAVPQQQVTVVPPGYKLERGTGYYPFGNLAEDLDSLF